MQTLQPEGVEPGRTRRPWLTILVAAVVLVGMGLGAWAIVQAAQAPETELETATGLVDDWLEGYNNNDPDAIAAVFTETGEYQDRWPFVRGATAHGREAIRSLAAEPDGDRIKNAERTDDGTVSDSGSYVFIVQFEVEPEGTAMISPVEITLDGDLASRINWLEWEGLDEGLYQD